MGSGYSHFQHATFPESRPPMFAVSLTGRPTSVKDKVLLTYCNPRARAIIIDAFMTHWSYGVKKVDELNPACHKIKLKDYPFESCVFEDSIMIKKVMGKLLVGLAAVDWVPLVGCDLQSMDDVSTVLFRHDREGLFDRSDPVIVSINSDNRLIIQNLRRSSKFERFVEVLKNFEKPTVEELEDDVIAIGFEEFLWEKWTKKDHAMLGNKVVLEAIKFLADDGYRLLVNFRVKKKTDCLYFVKADATSETSSEFFLMSLLEGGELGFVGDPLASELTSPNRLANLIQDVIRAAWPHGIDFTQQKQHYDLLCIAENPWLSYPFSPMSTVSRQTLARVLERLAAEGWLATTSLDLNRSTHNLSSILFRKCCPVTTRVVVVALVGPDLIRLINGDREIWQTLSSAIGEAWTIKNTELGYLHGQPFDAEYHLSSRLSDELNMSPFISGQFLTKALIMHVIHAMEKMSYSLLITAAVNGFVRTVEDDDDEKEVSDPDSLFFIPTADLAKAKSLSGGGAMASGFAPMASTAFAGAFPEKAPIPDDGPYPPAGGAPAYPPAYSFGESPYPSAPSAPLPPYSGGAGQYPLPVGAPAYPPVYPPVAGAQQYPPHMGVPPYHPSSGVPPYPSAPTDSSAAQNTGMAPSAPPPSYEDAIKKE